jgi:hypothetical protein
MTEYEEGRASRDDIVNAAYKLFTYAQNISYKIKSHNLEQLFPLPNDELMAFIRAVSASSKAAKERKEKKP